MAKKKDLGATAEFKMKRQKQTKLKLWHKIIIGISIAVLSLIVIVILAAGITYLVLNNSNVEESIDSNITENELLAPPPESDELVNTDDETGISEYIRKDKTYTFLIVGCDRAKWLTDVMMIATYDTVNQKFAIMQIPRDTYVMVNNKLIVDEEGNITYENFDGVGDYGCKINSVVWHGGNLAGIELERIKKLAKDADGDEFKKICEESFLNITPSELRAYMGASGKEKTSMEYDIKLKFGIKYLTALLARSFGTPVDFYAQLNLDGFVNIVDAIGGVDVYIQEDMDYEDIYQNPPLKIHLKKGMQHLDGKKAEQFIRFRYGYAAADIARIDAQKIFMTAFIKKVFSLEGIANMEKLITEVTANLETNMTLGNAGYFATEALGIDFNNIVMLTLPGWSLYVDGVSYYTIDKDVMIQTVNEYLNKYTEPLTEEYFCAIEAGPGTNYTTPPMTAEDIENEQPDLGFMY